MIYNGSLTYQNTTINAVLSWQGDSYLGTLNVNKPMFTGSLNVNLQTIINQVLEDRLALQERKNIFGFFRYNGFTQAAPLQCLANTWTNVPLFYDTVNPNLLPSNFADFFFPDGKFKGASQNSDYGLEIYFECDQAAANTKGVVDFFIDNGAVEYAISRSQEIALPSDANVDQTARTAHLIFIGAELFQFGAQMKVKFDGDVNLYNLRYELREKYHVEV